MIKKIKSIVITSFYEKYKKGFSYNSNHPKGYKNDYNSIE